ncbi:DUF885 domain-containing protein [Halioglobus maricola]|uniref:DUF885 domain-containing protein n=2 Tax=Halioglobus maricola TaxID=2601894 RepID=A0A5P9NQ53_9GAMM|nr:DUF885 domain-containing protein [Halioglobus maricola]
MVRAPYTASYRGQDTDNGKWNSISESHQEESQAIREQRLAVLDGIDTEALSSKLQLSQQLYRSDLERRSASDAFRHHKYVIHQHRGPHTQVASNLINVHTVTNAADAEAYISRIQDTGRWFDEVIEQLRIREEKGMFLANWAYPKMVEASRNVISGAPFSEGDDSTIWADFKAKMERLELSHEQQQDLLARASNSLLEALYPAYERLIEEFEHQAQLAPVDDGVWKFPNGEAFYAERLRWYTTTELTADEVHNIGLREVARVHKEMLAVMEQVEFDGDLAAFFEFMRNDEQFYYPATDEGRAAYMAEATRLIDVMRTRLPEQFGLFPKAPMIVKRVEAFRERSGGKAFYQRPPADGSRPGIYYANLYNMAQMPKYQMEALAYHEGIPGHHMQLAISVELEGVPEFQKHTTFTAFTEGWGLYSEFLPKEMGFYADPYSDFGRLAMELWRAARLVVDTGIHSKRWTREEAIAYLIENTPNAAGDASKAIERYIAQPGQATAYMIGKLKIVELREKARTALGEDFDIRAFHDEVLKDGPVPLSILEAKIDRLIEQNMSSPSA